MEGFKEFSGKSLDEAISEACSYFNAQRERLEIDIIQDAKSGIFGLVGARKAKVRARRMQLHNSVESIVEEQKRSYEETVKISSETSSNREDIPDALVHSVPQNEKKENLSAPKARTVPKIQETAASNKDVQQSVASASTKNIAKEAKDKKESKIYKDDKKEAILTKDDRSRKAGTQGFDQETRRKNYKKPVNTMPSAHTQPNSPKNIDFVTLSTEEMDDSEGLQRIPFAQLDQNQLQALSIEVVRKLIHPIVGELPVTASLEEGRICVHIACDEDSGLLIGREGQTLTALQYIASRIVSRGMNAAVRVQLDAGEYRSRQDEKLREIALTLAQKVQATGRPYSTRPLSSYHRRIVHVAVQDMPDVFTRSSGDGPLKRVVLQRRRGQ